MNIDCGRFNLSSPYILLIVLIINNFIKIYRVLHINFRCFVNLVACKLITYSRYLFNYLLYHFSHSRKFKYHIKFWFLLILLFSILIIKFVLFIFVFSHPTFPFLLNDLCVCPSYLSFAPSYPPFREQVGQAKVEETVI